MRSRIEKRGVLLPDQQARVRRANLAILAGRKKLLARAAKEGVLKDLPFLRPPARAIKHRVLQSTDQAYEIMVQTNDWVREILVDGDTLIYRTTSDNA